MPDLTEETVANEVRELVANGNLDTLTARSVMNTIGQKYGVENMRPWKGYVNERIDLEITAMDAGEDEGGDDEANQSPPEDNDGNSQESEVEDEKPQAARRLSVFKKPVVVIDPLKTLLGDDLLPRSQISKRVMDIAKQRNLQDPSDKRKFTCDSELEAIFGTTEFTMFSVNKLIVPLLRKPEDCGKDFIARASVMEEQLTAEMLNEEPKKRTKDEQKGARKLSGLKKPVVLVEPLKSLLGEDLLARSQLSKRISEYAKANGLQDPKDGRKILCDDRLKEVFGVDHFTFFSVNKLLAPLVKKPADCGEEMIQRAHLLEQELLADMDDDEPPRRKKKKTGRG